MTAGRARSVDPFGFNAVPRRKSGLRRAGFEPYGWIINASLATSNSHEPVPRRRATLEHGQIRDVRDELAQRAWIALAAGCTHRGRR